MSDPWVGQTFTVRDTFLQEHDRDILQFAHLQRAKESVEDNPRTQAAHEAADTGVKEELYAADNHLPHTFDLVDSAKCIVYRRIEPVFKPSTIVSWDRRFRHLGGHFKRDSRGRHNIYICIYFKRGRSEAPATELDEDAEARLNMEHFRLHRPCS